MVEMFGDSNGHIKLCAKQKYKFLSATKAAKEGREEVREDICSISTLFHLGFFTWLLCGQECLPGRFENICFSQIRH